MAEFKYKIKKISVREGLKLAGAYPNTVYSEEFFKFTKEKYGLAGGFLLVYQRTKPLLLFPVNYSAEAIFSVSKDYTEPFFLAKDREIDWPDLAKTIRGAYNCKCVSLNFGFINNRKMAGNLRESKISVYVLKLKENENRDTILKMFAKKTRNEVRKSEKFGFNLRIGTEKNLDEIYNLYKENMRRHGTPVKDKQIFEDLYFLYGDKLKMILAYDNDILAGVNIYLINNGYLRLIYNFSKIEYWKKCVNNFLYFEIIEWEYKNGARLFDFGPSSDRDKSHLHFKIGFGGVRVPLVRIISSEKSYLIKQWLGQKRYNLKIRLNKLLK